MKLPTSAKQISAGLGLALLIVLVVSTALIVWASDTRADTFIAIMKIIASWPLVVLILLFGAGIGFHDQVGKLLERLATVRAGPVEATFPQPQPPIPADLAAPDVEPPASQEALDEARLDREQLEREINELRTKRYAERQQALGLAEIAERALDRAAQAEEREQQAIQAAEYWRFEAFRHVLVPTTLSALRWLNTEPPPTEEMFHVAWGAVVPDPNERARMLDALTRLGMVERVSSKLKVTEEGRAFLYHIHAQGTQLPPGAIPV